MRAIIELERPSEPDGPVAPLWKRQAWFGGLAIASSALTLLVAYGLRALLLAL
jgi:hypothetical protein